jgi:hypothetical protein
MYLYLLMIVCSASSVILDEQDRERTLSEHCIKLFLNTGFVIA